MTFKAVEVVYRLVHFFFHHLLLLEQKVERVSPRQARSVAQETKASQVWV